MSQSILLAGPSEMVLMYWRRSSMKVRTLWLDVGYILSVSLMNDGFCGHPSSRAFLWRCFSRFVLFCSAWFERENIDMMKVKRGARMKVRATVPLDVGILCGGFFAGFC